MAKAKREQAQAVELGLDEVRPTEQPSPATPEDQLNLLEMMMEQVVMELDTMPVRAQLGVLQMIIPDLLSQLDADDRMYWAQELLGEGAPDETPNA